MRNYSKLTSAAALAIPYWLRSSYNKQYVHQDGLWNHITSHSLLGEYGGLICARLAEMLGVDYTLFGTKTNMYVTSLGLLVNYL